MVVITTQSSQFFSCVELTEKQLKYYCGAINVRFVVDIDPGAQKSLDEWFEGILVPENGEKKLRHIFGWNGDERSFKSLRLSVAPNGFNRWAMVMMLVFLPFFGFAFLISRSMPRLLFKKGLRR